MELIMEKEMDKLSEMVQEMETRTMQIITETITVMEISVNLQEMEIATGTVILLKIMVIEMETLTMDTEMVTGTGMPTQSLTLTTKNQKLQIPFKT